MVPLNSIELLPEAQSPAGHVCWTEHFERDFNAPQMWAASSHVYTHPPLFPLEIQWNPPLFLYVLMLYLHSYSKYLTRFCPAEYKTHIHKKTLKAHYFCHFNLFPPLFIQNNKAGYKVPAKFSFFFPKKGKVQLAEIAVTPAAPLLITPTTSISFSLHNYTPIVIYVIEGGRGLRTWVLFALTFFKLFIPPMYPT